jgi:diguanylate cyclase (GGDEF)-like protein
VVFVDQSMLPPVMNERLRSAGFHDVWYVAVESPLAETTLRIVAASPTHHVPANGPKNRLVRARELAAAVLLRAEADVLLEHAAAHDPLTDLPSRAAFHQLARSVDPLTERAALHLDLDGLKRINTEFGQSGGDAVLQIVADRLRVTCSPDDIIARVGDDEFTILLTADMWADRAADSLPERSLKLAAAVLRAICDTVVVGGRPLNISASVDVATASPGVSTDHLLTWADAAMHNAKQRGGGRICRYGVTYG